MYASSSATAKEILKITSVLVNANENTVKDDEEIRSLQEIDLSDKVPKTSIYIVVSMLIFFCELISKD